MESLSQDSQSPSRNLNPEPPVYEGETLDQSMYIWFYSCLIM
jgi:hypothetical protein